MTRPSFLEARTLAHELEQLEERLRNGGDRDLVEESLLRLRRTFEEFRAAQERLVERNDELAQAHLQLDAERRRYAELFELAPDAYLVTDPNGVVEEANRSAVELFRIDRRFLLGKPLAACVAKEEGRQFRKRLLALGHEQGAQRFDLRLSSRGGVRADVAVTAAPILREHDGELLGIRWVLRDTSEAKQNEERLWELNTELEARVEERTRATETQTRLLEAILDQLPVGVVVAAAPDGRVIRSNRYARDMLGSRFEAREGSPLLRALHGGETVVDQRVEVEAGGEPRVLVVGATPVSDDTGAIVAAAVVFEDATDRERREQAEREFVANAAHELRTPLAAIASAVEVLQAGAKDDPAERDLFVGHIEREVARLARLGRALLVLARAQSHAEAPRLEIVALRPLLEDVAEELRTHPDVTVSIRCRRDLAALTSRDLIVHALENLAGNAARHTAKGRIALAASARHGDAVLEVRDTGPGMPPEVREQVFTRFYRSGPRDPERFGLGLAIAREVVVAVGGEIELVSEVGKGTTARVRLPLARMVSQ